MEGTTTSASSLPKRAVPTIGGSPAAFIVVIIVLVIVIIVACTASFYLLREEANADHEALTHRTRPQYHLPGSAPTRPSRKSKNKSWYLPRILLGQEPRSDGNPGDPSKSKIGSGRVHINSDDSDWDGSTDNEMSKHKLQGVSQQRGRSSSSAPMSQKEFSADMLPSTSLSGSRFFSPSSDTASSVHFDPHGIRGIPYLDRAAPQPTNMSLQSHLYSPIHSPSASPPPNPKRRSIPVSIETAWTDESQNAYGSSQAFTMHPQTSVHTFSGGSKFIENL
ncbi:hypothetical protein CVT24_012800 [Panaeolus cyanescens]|uniref:Uncharacterized protein n=1 Tax=Panaeolus cyanescens TaxID=181874 RepID=A0A409W2L5_9AGAR|nr:hypothetical protein CVT24_012800 [Panaeolus cyanescens]